ncbi:hypothetical protein FACS1894102_5900 [Spirochaetia bacterium]|nr:hypothetical protein FACS1894102_5900 [Spirochaetia bacterium]
MSGWPLLSIAVKFRARAVYTEISKGASSEITLNTRDLQQFRTLPSANTSDTYFNKSQKVLEDLINRITVAELASATRIYTFTDTILEAKLAELEKDYTEGSKYAAGLPLTLDSGEEILAKYPREALAEWKPVENQLNAALNQARALMESHRNEVPQISSNREITRLRDEGTNISQRLTRLQNAQNTASAVARTNVQRAENFETQGKNSIAAARQFLENNKFDEAHNQVERASTYYTNSLELQENPELRKALMSVIVPLNVEITLIERSYVEREVREIVNTARDTYFEGNLERAENQLTGAQDIWAKISSETNPEVDYWLTIIRGALTLRSGRTIPITAPLYPEMSQLLSAAEKNYNEGVQLLKSSQRKVAEEKLTLARAKTQEVRLMFPVNQDAGILELKIDKVIDPVNFEASFQQRFVTAVSGTKRGLFQSFADLQDLAAIYPDYRGMSAAIYQAEIDMGLRAPPPDTRAIRRSEELLAAAQRLFRAGIRSQFPTVLDNVNEALRLNPNNVLALQLKDQVQTAMGTAAVSPDDIYTEQEYIRAVTALQNGQKILAMSIVERLMQMPRNRDSVRIKNLRQRIEASM